ncbi:MAG: hypothetical protein RMM53_02325, partial [Bacteroidia bacterium]|nr:hypothetical protein [Bacteroidia bacterium]MDW8333032.1 hypothetical protein [Bacteroidia bacterium]
MNTLGRLMAAAIAAAYESQAQIAITGANAVVTPTEDVYYSLTGVPGGAVQYRWTVLGEGATPFDFLTPVLRVRFEGTGQNRIVAAVTLDDGATLRDTLTVYKNTCAAVVGTLSGPTGVCRNISAALSVDAALGPNRIWEVAPGENGPWREARFGLLNNDKTAYQTPGLQADSVYRVRILSEGCEAVSNTFRVMAQPEPSGSFGVAP